MRGKMWRIGFTGLVVLAAWSGSALGATAVSVAGVGTTVPPSNKGWVVGWTFLVTGSSNIFVTHAGVYDDGENGLATAHDVGIWHSKELKMSVQVPAGAGGECIAGYRYVELASPIELTPSDIAYTVGVLFPIGNEDARIQSASNVQFDSSGTIVPWWSSTNVGKYSRQSESSSLTRPEQTIWEDQRGLNANFRYTVPGAPTNQPPEANDDSAGTKINASVPIDVLGNDSDPDGDPLSIASFEQGANGSVTAVGDGLTYTPNQNFVGSDSFTYTISDGKGGVSTATVSVIVDPGTIQIDIKPGSSPNTVNLGSKGVIPVAILSDEGFDATALDPETILLEGASVAVRGKSNRYMSHSEDVNGDGRADLVAQFDTENLAPGVFQDGIATVIVENAEGQVLYRGEDEITVVPPQ